MQEGNEPANRNAEGTFQTFLPASRERERESYLLRENPVLPLPLSLSLVKWTNLRYRNIPLRFGFSELEKLAFKKITLCSRILGFDCSALTDPSIHPFISISFVYGQKDRSHVGRKNEAEHR